MKDVNVVLKLGTPEDLSMFQKAEIEMDAAGARGRHSAEG